MEKALIERIVLFMDLNGWEQDGRGMAFVNVGGDGSRREFSSWHEVLGFARGISKTT